MADNKRVRDGSQNEDALFGSGLALGGGLETIDFGITSNAGSGGSGLGAGGGGMGGNSGPGGGNVIVNATKIGVQSG
jgi:hypothetical protein